MSRLILFAVVVSASWTWASSRPATANDFANANAQPAVDDEQWYYRREQSEYRPDPRAIVQQKAMARAEHRQARLTTMRWFGMSNSRPTASATPFCSIYSPVWQRPGGRPFAWYASSQPVYVFVRGDHTTDR